MLRRPGGTAFTGVRGLTTVGKMEAPARELPVEVGETSLFERAGGGRRAGVPGGQDDLERANTDYRQRLRDAGFGRHLIRYWEEAVEGLDVRNAIPPDCATGTATPCCSRWTTSRSHPRTWRQSMPASTRWKAHSRKQPARMRRCTCSYVPTTRHGRTASRRSSAGYRWLPGRSGSRPTRRRGPTLRERIEAACGSRIRHRAREHMDPLALSKDA